jgi:hypothetical protein
MGRKELRRFGMEIANPERVRIYEAKLSPETIEALGFNKKQKNHFNYLTEYIGVKEFSKIFLLFKETIIESIPEEEKQKCRVCSLHESENGNEKLCTVLQRGGEITMLLASWEFINLIESNRKIFRDKKQVAKLTRNFFGCFRFYQGRVFFELEEMKSFLIAEGLRNIKNDLEQHPLLKSIEIINDSLNVLEEQHIYFKLKNKYKNPYIKTQIKWFREQERFYDKKALLQEKYDNSPTSSNTSLQNNPQETNPYPHIFKNKKAFDFFERLIGEFDIKNSRSQVSDLTDIYTLMKKDNYILDSFKPAPFVNWLNERYEYLSITRLETVSSRTTPKAKYKIYHNSKQLFL